MRGDAFHSVDLRIYYVQTRLMDSLDHDTHTALAYGSSSPSTVVYAHSCAHGTPQTGYSAHSGSRTNHGIPRTVPQPEHILVDITA